MPRLASAGWWRQSRMAVTGCVARASRNMAWIPRWNALATLDTCNVSGFDPSMSQTRPDPGLRRSNPLKLPARLRGPRQEMPISRRGALLAARLESARQGRLLGAATGPRQCGQQSRYEDE